MLRKHQHPQHYHISSSVYIVESKAGTTYQENININTGILYYAYHVLNPEMIKTGYKKHLDTMHSIVSQVAANSKGPNYPMRIVK